MLKTVTPRKGELTRGAILGAAIDRFGRDGYRATSVTDVARDAGVGPTVPYTYFADKETLFLAAIDTDAAAVIDEGLRTMVGDADLRDWKRTLVVTLVGALETHPLARRLLAGLEPGVTDRVVEIPALMELRKACAERIRAEQLAGTVRPDIDAHAMGNGIIAIVLSLLMSVVQIGQRTALTYADDVVAVFEAALHSVPPPPTP